MSRSLRIVVACAVALLIIGTAGLAALMLMPSPPPPTNSMLGALGGPFTLTATDGRTVTDQTYLGKWVLIYFGYTSCPDACPTALNNMGVALDRLGAEAGALQPVFVTVDPKRDTREALAEYLKSFDPHIVALTGTEEQIAAVVKEFRVYVSAHPGVAATTPSITAASITSSIPRGSSCESSRVMSQGRNWPSDCTTG